MWPNKPGGSPIPAMMRQSGVVLLRLTGELRCARPTVRYGTLAIFVTSLVETVTALFPLPMSRRSGRPTRTAYRRG
jgi:hypothetical protein